MTSLALATASSSSSSIPSSSSIDTTTPEWLVRRLSEFDLQPHDFSTTGRGLQTTRDRSAGDVLIRVPESEAITVKSILQHFPVLEQAATKSLEEQDEKLTDEQILAAGLLLLLQQSQPQESSSTTNPSYALSLPPQYSVLQMPSELLACLPRSYQKLIQAYHEHVAKLQHSLMSVLPETEKVVIADNNDFVWAFATVRSRCVGMDGEDDARIRTGGQGEIRVMLPGFDLLNHQFGAQTTPAFVSANAAASERADTGTGGALEHGGYYEIRSEDTYPKDDQVFISYSDHRDNLKMLMTYGFCISSNPNRLVTFDVQDLLEACARARPKYFSEQVLGQLWGLLLKLKKERDLFVWDASAQAPQPSLQKGIQMMVELEKQFLETDGNKDEPFAGDVLAALRTARQEELSQRLQMMDQAALHKHVEPSWIPMLESIRVLLKAETSYLQQEGDCATTGDQ